MINHSSLKLFQACRKKYELQKQGAEPGSHSGDLIFGSALHFCLARLVQGEPFDDVLTTWGMYWGSVKPDAYEWGRFGYDYYETLGDTFLRKFCKSTLKDIEPIWVEKRLEGTIAGVPVFGTPDLVGKFRGVMSIIDFKTSGSNYPLEQAMTGTQMPFYHELVECQSEKLPPIEQYVYLVFNKQKCSLQEPVIAPATASLRAAHTLDIGDVLREMSGPYTPTRNTAHCFSYNRRCELFDACWGRLEKK